MEELCFVENEATVTIADLYNKYLAWCNSNGDKNFLGKVNLTTELPKKALLKVPALAIRQLGTV